MTDMTTGFGAVPRPEEPARDTSAFAPPEPRPMPPWQQHPVPTQMPQYAPPAYSPFATQGPQANAAVVNNIRIGGGRPFNHMLHLVLTVCTCGMWAPVWLVAYLLHPKG